MCVGASAGGGASGALGGAASGAVAGSVAGPYGAVAGAVLGAAGSIMSGGAAARAAKLNEQAETQAAEGSITAGNERARDEGLRTGQIIGRQLADQAAGNIQTGSGSALAIREDAIRTSGLSLQNILTNTSNVVQGDDAKATGYADQASTATESGYLGAAKSLIGGASTIGDQYLKWQGSNGGSPLPGT